LITLLTLPLLAILIITVLFKYSPKYGVEVHFKNWFNTQIEKRYIGGQLEKNDFTAVVDTFQVIVSSPDVKYRTQRSCGLQSMILNFLSSFNVVV
jgi:hypothetical protein